MPKTIKHKYYSRLPLIYTKASCGVSEANRSNTKVCSPPEMHARQTECLFCFATRRTKPEKN